MKEIVAPSHSTVELQLTQREEKQSVTLRPIEAAETLSKNKAINDNKDDKEAIDGTLIADLKDNLTKINQYIPVTATNLSFEFDDKGDPPFIRVIDKGNNEVIREIPSKEFREVAKALEELADKLTGKGLLLDRTA
ncbi:flagellar protein FlaG [Pseudoalteromonas xiamenensis]|uniref:Flagellar protein FlaG n=1 Tax=Pseudoalteromonas xiamenensis TaxID=882626 RepID=A0A975DGA6_9GAMM|nr:flagellar protein FlaG [Pseudoalteromonas xiamenensis]QTH71029.1 flagellar protein FlaG [Pseudoalteromonas xiamenensis]